MGEATVSLLGVAIILFIVLAVFIKLTIIIVPQQKAYVVESLGKYHKTLEAGVNFLFPVLQTVRYRHSLKEQALDISEQICITRDNVQVGVDGVLYFKVINPAKASYGIENYLFAVTQLAQTALRSEIGKIELDKTFEERNSINFNVVHELDKASEAWGIKVMRYEIKNIIPPQDVINAMEKQMRAEREKRAVILQSEGARDAAINEAEGRKQMLIKQSEASKTQQINEASGKAEAILTIAQATAQGLKEVGLALEGSGGENALKLRVAEQYIEQLGRIAKESTTMVLPMNVAELGSVFTLAQSLLQKNK